MKEKAKEDYELRDKIKDELKMHMGRDAKDINVDSYNGNIVLSGIVDALADKKEAKEITSHVDGVKKIENSLTVSIDGRATDKEISSLINERFSQGEYADYLTGVTAKIGGGTVILEGTVETQRDRKLAIDEASKTLGTKQVVSHLRISTESDDITITNEVNRSIVHSGINDSDITIGVDDGVVRLNGAVTTKEQIEDLTTLCEDIPGVKNVISHLHIRPWSIG